jgi:predicted nucleic acid-binding protein
LPREILKILIELPLLEIRSGYWERAGGLRAKILAKKLKARVADTLIAQSCLDNKVGLITRDSDFMKFAQVANLKLISH